MTSFISSEEEEFDYSYYSQIDDGDDYGDLTIDPDEEEEKVLALALALTFPFTFTSLSLSFPLSFPLSLLLSLIFPFLLQKPGHLNSQERRAFL